MRLTIHRKTLFQHLSRLVPFAGRSPGLACVRIEAGDGMLSLAATDNAAWTSSTIEVEGAEGDGLHACDLDLLRGVVAASEDEVVALSATRSHVEVTDDGGTSRIRSIERSQIAPLPRPSGSPVMVDLAPFAAGLASVLPAVAREQARYAINGVCLDAGAMVATDGRMLATRDSQTVHGEPVLMPTRLAKGLVDAARFCAASNPVAGARQVQASVLVAGSAIECNVEVDGFSLLVGSTRLEGLFPPWRGVIPKSRPTATLEVDVEAMSSLVRRAATLTDDESRGIRLDLDGARLRAASRGQGGEAAVGIEVQGTGCIAIGANPEQLLALLDACPAPRVAVSFTAPERPLVLSVEEAGWTAVLMPLALA